MTRDRSVASRAFLGAVPGKPFASVDARRGKGPRKGAKNAGRPSGDFRWFMHALREDAAVREAIKRAAYDPDSRAFGQVIKLLSAYDEQGPDPRVAVGEIRQRLIEQFRLIREAFPPDVAERVCDVLAAAWS